MENKNLARFLLTFFLGWIGSLIINHSSLKAEGWTSRTGCCRLCLTLSFRLRRNRGTLPRRQTPAVQNRPAKPYPNTNIALLYTRRAVLSTGSFERIPKRRKVCAIRRCAVPIPRAIRAFFRRLITAADAAG